MVSRIHDWRIFGIQDSDSGWGLSREEGRGTDPSGGTPKSGASLAGPRVVQRTHPNPFASMVRRL